MNQSNRMFEQAAMFAQMFQGSGQGDSTDGLAMMNRMLKMMEIVEMIQSLQKPPVPLSPDGGVDGVRIFDEDSQVPGLKAIKSAIPYLEPRYRKNLGLIVKLIEIHKLIETYGYSAMQTHGRPPGADDNGWRREMLMAVRPHMSAEKQNITDLLIKCIDMMEIVRKMEALNHDGQY